MKKITLQVNGREMTFSEEVLISIVEKHLSGETAQKTIIVEVVPTPIEGRCFKVRPKDIDQKLFEEKRIYSRQEETRKLILKAFEEMRRNPEKYGKNFTTMAPKMTETQAFKDKTVAELKEIATNNGGHTADWVEQALEWAQRIANGESWKELCDEVNNEHTWYRLVVWDTGYARAGGGSNYFCDDPTYYRDKTYYRGIMSATHFYAEDYDDSKILHGVVPLIVCYEKDMKEITLQVNGREMTFSEEELISIVEKHLSGETTQETTIVEVVPKPMDGRWFEVRPNDIDQRLFENKRENCRQEETRKLILKAFEEMRWNPEKYGKNFMTMTPKMTKTQAFEEGKTVAELKEIATNNGGHTADWVELALEWAQRIANGESWKKLCNNVNTEHTCYRLVVWDRGYARIGGCSTYFHDERSATDFDWLDYDDSKILNGVVPLIVRYEE